MSGAPLRSDPSSPRVRRAATYWLMYWSLWRRLPPETGYCQGMNLVVGALLETAARAGSLEDDHKIILSAVEERRCQRKAFWLCHAAAHGGPKTSTRIRGWH